VRSEKWNVITIFEEFAKLFEDVERVREKNIAGQLEIILNEVNEMSLSQIRTWKDVNIGINILQEFEGKFDKRGNSLAELRNRNEKIKGMNQNFNQRILNDMENLKRKFDQQNEEPDKYLRVSSQASEIIENGMSEM
jgi:hypothetical protein